MSKPGEKADVLEIEQAHELAGVVIARGPLEGGE
jgi:hypothetical protein